MYPGSFNPPTTAHVAIAVAARHHHELDVVTLVVSRQPLGKSALPGPPLEERLEVLRQSTADHDGIEVELTDLRFIVDIAAAADVVIMGADKWRQVNDPVFYAGDPAARDAAVAGLPTVSLVPRPPHPIPTELALPLPDAVLTDIVDVSSTEARSGRLDFMTPTAAAFARRTGHWLD
ncbi:MAG: hypothetical protein HKN26_11450 [Acidimicrobiales bacterium]|nr:hypothetical protein [Acidimicrobiales bacterium]